MCFQIFLLNIFTVPHVDDDVSNFGTDITVIVLSMPLRILSESEFKARPYKPWHCLPFINPGYIRTMDVTCILSYVPYSLLTLFNLLLLHLHIITYHYTSLHIITHHHTSLHIITYRCRLYTSYIHISPHRYQVIY